MIHCQKKDIKNWEIMLSVLAEKLGKTILRKLFSNLKFWRQSYASGDQKGSF